MTITQAMLSVLIIPLFNNQKLHFLGITFLIVVYVLSTIGSTLIYPAEDKILPNIVEKKKLPKVNGIFQMSYQTLDLFLNAGATILITFLSIKNTIIISALVFAFALVLDLSAFLDDDDLLLCLMAGFGAASFLVLLNLTALLCAVLRLW